MREGCLRLRRTKWMKIQEMLDQILKAGQK